MFEPTEHEVDDDIRKSMALFAQAKVGPVAALEPRGPRHMLLVLDGSAQDQTSIAVADGLRQRHGGSISVLDGREHQVANDLAERVGASLGAVPRGKQQGDSYEQILASAAETECDLIVVPCPFGRDWEKVGTDSTGTVIDILLARSPVPLLVTRRTDGDVSDPFGQVRFVLLGENEAAPSAASWASGLVAPGGRVHFLLVLTQESFENVRELVQSLAPEADLTPEKLADSLAHSQLHLHRAFQKTAANAGFKYRFDVVKDDDDPQHASHDSQTSTLVVLPLERRDHRSQGYVHHRICHAASPILVVPKS